MSRKQAERMLQPITDWFDRCLEGVSKNDSGMQGVFGVIGKEAVRVVKRDSGPILLRYSVNELGFYESGLERMIKEESGLSGLTNRDILIDLLKKADKLPVISSGLQDIAMIYCFGKRERRTTIAQDGAPVLEIPSALAIRVDGIGYRGVEAGCVDLKEGQITDEAGLRFINPGGAENKARLEEVKRRVHKMPEGVIPNKFRDVNGEFWFLFDGNRGFDRELSLWEAYLMDGNLTYVAQIGRRPDGDKIEKMMKNSETEMRYWPGGKVISRSAVELTTLIGSDIEKYMSELMGLGERGSIFYDLALKSLLGLVRTIPMDIVMRLGQEVDSRR